MPAEIIDKNIALFIGIETTEGTAATIAAANALYIAEMKRPVKNQKSVKRDFSTQTRPLDIAEQNVMTWWDFEFDVPWMYSGTAGTPGPLEKLFLMCGASSTTLATTSVTYARESSRTLFDSATLDWRTPLEAVAFDYQRRATGARGQLGFKIGIGEDIVFNVKGVGNYTQPARVAKLVPTYGTQQANIFGVPKVSAITARTLNAKNLCLQSIDASNFFGWDIDWLEECGGERASPKNSATGGTLKLQMAMPDWQSEFNPFAYADRSTLQRMPFEFSVGSVAGKKLSIKVDEVQPGKPVEVALPNGNAGMEMELTILHNPTIVEL